MTRQRSAGSRSWLIAVLIGLLGAVAVSGAVLLLPATDETSGQPDDDTLATSGPVAEQTSTPGARPAADPRAVALLRRAARAAATTAYTGTQFVSTWDREGAAAYVVDVDNEPGKGTSVRVHDSATNPQGAGYTTLPAEAQGGPSPAPSEDELSLLLDSYDLAVGGSEQVAGRPATVVEVRRPGAGVAARFWVDAGTGLVLRREVYDRSGRVVRANAFVSVDVDAARFVKHPPPLLSGPAGRALTGAQLGGWAAKGWACPAALPGGLRLVVAASTTADGRPGAQTPGPGGNDAPILHLTYSDGLSAVSVFQQRGELDRSGMSGYRAERWAGHEVLVSTGFPRRVLWSAHGRVFTVVGDAADETVESAVAALPHDAAAESDAGSGPLHRLRRGVQRLASWLDPVH